MTSALALQCSTTSRLISATGKDGLDKLVCPQHMGLHSSVAGGLQC